VSEPTNADSPQQKSTGRSDTHDDKSPPAAPPWAKVLSAVFGGLTLLFLMALIVMSLFGYTIPEESCCLFAGLFGIFGGLAFGFISGTAMASGTVPVPGTGSKIAVSAGGGVAFVVILAFVGYWLACGHTRTPPVLVGIDNVRITSTKGATTATVHVDYHLQGWEHTQSAFLEISWNADFAQPIRKTLDTPPFGQANLDIDLDGSKEGSPF
jgi:hypothetical protein